MGNWGTREPHKLPANTQDAYGSTHNMAAVTIVTKGWNPDLIQVNGGFVIGFNEARISLQVCCLPVQDPMHRTRCFCELLPCLFAEHPVEDPQMYVQP